MSDKEDDLVICDGFVQQGCGGCIHGKPHAPIDDVYEDNKCNEALFHCVMRNGNQTCDNHKPNGER